MPGHIRFGKDDPPASEEPLATTNPQDLHANDQPGPESDSDDDAPEAIGHTLARDEAMATKREASRAIVDRKQADRQKRKTQAARLEEQAKISKRSSKRKRAAAGGAGNEDKTISLTQGHDDDENEDTITQNSAPKRLRKKELPDLLPDEILAAAPPVRLPTPEPESEITFPERSPRTAEKVEQTLAKTAKAPKDVRRGPVKVRVLEEKNALLPPRANTQSRNLLEGMRNRHGTLETKPLKKGFASRSGI
ncbi:hypothetical protein EV356DRAFT_170069 [Viridothelium virens]|uniref:Uncharacterized protein n=1 Tax=Viridothelium virens TaxID=1048519 RepID=A0A6A6HMG7_VIRVR|nr:hypothetical protein EV356DRAFT_170069 [Viridothelium virens]